MKKILVFGHLPKYAGGKQSSGLANVIWQLANNMNDVGSPDYRIVLAATDIHQNETVIDGTEVLGWNRNLLLKVIIKNPLFVFYYLFKSIKLSVKYRFNLSNIYFKLLFYHFAINKVNPDIIHVHGCTSVSFFEIYNFKKYKVIATIHGISGQDKNIPDYKSYQKMEKDLNHLNFQFAGYITTDLIRQWKHFYGTPGWHMIPIPNAYDQKVFYYSKITDFKTFNSENLITLATIASISELKGQIRVVQALNSIKNIKYKYVCVGGGNPEQIGKLKRATIGDHIEFEYLGYQEPYKIREILKNVDYMILPSSSEGFGLVYLESIACGVPVILPQHLPIVHETNLLTDENSILLDDESTQSIAKVLAMLDKCKFDREIVTNSIKEFDWSNIAAKYISYIEQLTKNS